MSGPKGGIDGCLESWLLGWNEPLGEGGFGTSSGVITSSDCSDFLNGLHQTPTPSLYEGLRSYDTEAMSVSPHDQRAALTHASGTSSTSTSTNVRQQQPDAPLATAGELQVGSKGDGDRGEEGGTSLGARTSSDFFYGLQRTPSLYAGLRFYEYTQGLDTEAMSVSPQPAALTHASGTSSTSTSTNARQQQPNAPLATAGKVQVGSKEDGDRGGRGVSAPAAKPKTREQKDEMWRAALPPSIFDGPDAPAQISLKRALQKHGLHKIRAMSADTIRQLYREWRDREAPMRRALRMKLKAAGSAMHGRRRRDDDSNADEGGGDEGGGDDGERVGTRKRRTTFARGAGSASGTVCKKKGRGRASSRRAKARSGAGDIEAYSDSHNHQGGGGGFQATIDICASFHPHLNLDHCALQQLGSTHDDGSGGNLFRTGSNVSTVSIVSTVSLLFFDIE